MNSTLQQVLTHFSADSFSTVFSGYNQHDFQVRLWDGSLWGDSEHPRFTLVLKRPPALEAMFRSPNELTLGEAYIYDDLDVEGDLEAAIALADYLVSCDPETLPYTLRLATRLFSNAEVHPESDRSARLQGSVHSPDRDRAAIHYHYDLPPEFFALWLDPHRLYSCAYFSSENDPLEEAQERKLDYLCRKLRLQPGDQLLDIGCGWGGLIVFATRHYQARVLGITLSVPQAEIARQRIREAGLGDSCRVEVCDYRDLPKDCQFDKIVSVGMFEHVGEHELATYFTRVAKFLRDGGTFLNTGISASATYHRLGPSFIDRYVFPDGELVPISQTLTAAEQCGFEVRDVESLREHYALTLHHWVRRLEAAASRAKQLTDETTYRIWRLYMAASAHAFRAARLNLYQVLFTKPDHGKSGVPLTREDWYDSSQPDSATNMPRLQPLQAGGT